MARHDCEGCGERVVFERGGLCRRCRRALVPVRLVVVPAPVNPTYARCESDGCGYTDRGRA